MTSHAGAGDREVSAKNETNGGKYLRFPPKSRLLKGF